MRKLPLFLTCVIVASMLLGIGGFASAAGMVPVATPSPNPAVAIGIIGGADGPTSVFVAGDDGDAGAAADDDTQEQGAAGNADVAGESVDPTLIVTPSPVPTAAPVANGDFTISVEMGYDGLIMMSSWSPAFITVTNNGVDFDGMLGVNIFLNQTEYDRYEIPLTLAGGATKRVILPIKPQTRQDMYAFELTKGGAIIAEARVTPTRLVSPETLTIAVLSEEPQALAYLNQKVNGLDTLRGEVWMTVQVDADTFPQTEELFSSFSMLVVDGFDVRTLDEQQQKALHGWLLKGGIVFVSGGAKAAEGYPFFEQWTGIAPGKPFEADDITPALLSYALVKGEPAGETVWLNPIMIGDSVANDGENGLIAMHRAGDGIILTAAFDMGGKPFTGWKSMTSVMPRILRQAASNDYLKLLDRLEQTRYYGDDSYRVQQLVNTLSVPNTQSGLPVIILLVVFVLLVGFGGYFIMKKVDRREWLWLAVPILALTFGVLMFLLSRGTTMNKPVTLTASRVTMEDGGAQVKTYIGVSTPQSGEMIISTDKNQLPTVSGGDSYWYDDPYLSDKLFRPEILRQRYRFGAEPALGFTAAEAWDIKLLTLSGLETDMGTIDSRIWMEKDGLHGEVVNNTDTLIKDAIVVTSYGYSVIGDVLPGGKETFEMLYPDKPIDQSAMGFSLEPNIMYSSLDIDITQTSSMYFLDNGIYTYLSPAIYGDSYNDYSLSQQNASAVRRETLVQLYEEEWSFYQGGSSFYFFGFNDSMGSVEVSLNDEPVKRTAHTAVIGARIPFEPIGPTGQVVYPQGVIKGEQVIDVGADSKPRLQTEDDVQTNQATRSYRQDTTYLDMSEPVAVRFALPEWGTYSIEKMTLIGMTYETIPTMYLYNNVTEKWDERLLLSASMDGKGWAPYIDNNGDIYVRYVPSESANRYESMSMPTIALKGEVNE